MLHTMIGLMAFDIEQSGNVYANAKTHYLLFHEQHVNKNTLCFYLYIYTQAVSYIHFYTYIYIFIHTIFRPNIIYITACLKIRLAMQHAVPAETN